MQEDRFPSETERATAAEPKSPEVRRPSADGGGPHYRLEGGQDVLWLQGGLQMWQLRDGSSR